MTHGGASRRGGTGRRRGAVPQPCTGPCTASARPSPTRCRSPPGRRSCCWSAATSTGGSSRGPAPGRRATRRPPTSSGCRWAGGGGPRGSSGGRGAARRGGTSGCRTAVAAVAERSGSRARGAGRAVMPCSAAVRRAGGRPGAGTPGYGDTGLTAAWRRLVLPPGRTAGVCISP